MNYTAKLKYEQYKLKVICNEDKEFLIRNIISQSANKDDMILINMENMDLEDSKVKIYATFKIATDKTKLMEELINRIVIESGIVSSGWRKLGHSKETEIEDDDDEI